MSDFLFKRSPNTEAQEFLRAKPVVAREVFDELLPDLKGRAFVVTGVEDANVLQDVRDMIADLPGGTDWDLIKNEIADTISPWLKEGATRRAELLLRTHGYQAYSAAEYTVIDRQRDVFPYLQYNTSQDDGVRDSHAALDGTVLPTNSPFWQSHYPPWDWGCRCTVIPLMKEDVDELRAEDADKLPEEQRILEGDRLRQAEAGTLVTAENGVPRRIDVRAPTEKLGGSGFASSATSVKIPVENLKSKYDAATWREFESYAERTNLDDGRSVLAWLNNPA